MPGPKYFKLLEYDLRGRKVKEQSFETFQEALHALNKRLGNKLKEFDQKKTCSKYERSI